MKNMKDKILAHFEPDLAVKLLEFGETLSKVDCDVFVLMSRKFCCLYDLLTSVGVTVIDKPVVSDKLLDTDTFIFQNKRVAIVDDIVICGTTIWKAKSNLLENYGAKEVLTYVFCTNEKYWVPECIDPDYKAVVLSDQRSLTFCASIVSALSIAPRPYAVDFPLFHQLEIKEKYWQLFISSQAWNVYDITNTMQELNGVSSLSFFPTTEVLDDFRSRIGESVFNLVEISKIRVYSIKNDWGFELSVMPIVTFKPILSDDISLITDSLESSLYKIGFETKDIARLGKQHNSLTSKLRLIQYISSILLARIFRKDVEYVLEKKLRIETRQLDVDLLFGKENYHIVHEIGRYLLENDTLSFLSNGVIEPSEIETSNTEFEDLFEEGQLNVVEINDFNQDNYRNVFADFSNIFLSLYRYKELPSRVKVREHAPLNQWDEIRAIDRLETGITWSGILTYLKKTYEYELTDKVKNVLSLILDYSIDKGICVPVTRYDESTGAIYRAYRHGEDVKFAEQETQLCGHLIETAIKSYDKEALPKLYLEKLLVLFIRVGVTRGIFQLQYGTSGQDGVAKIGFHLHGAVVKMKKRNNYNVESDLWLSRHLLERQVIERAGDNNYRFKEHFDAIQISTSSIPESKKFGMILGLLVKGVTKEDDTLRLTDDDLIFLSTCFRPKDVAAALYVEHDIFIDRLSPTVVSVLNAIAEGKAVPYHKRKEIVQGDGFTALNSIHKKFRGWRNSGAQQAISKGTRILTALNQDTAVLDWESYWDSLSILEREDEQSIFDKDIEVMARIGHRLLLNVNFLTLLLLLNPEEIEKTRKKRISSSVKKIKAFMERTIAVDVNLLNERDLTLVSNLDGHSNSDFRNFDILGTAKYLQKEIGSLNYEMSKTRGAVSFELDRFEQHGDGTISYDQVIYYDIVDSTATKKMRTHQDVEAYRSLIKKTKLGINDFVTSMQKNAQQNKDDMYCWNGNATSTNDAKYIFLSSAKQGFNNRRIKEFIDRLYSFSTESISFRMIVSPTNVFHSDVFKRFRSTEVEGEHFWEHYSRVHKFFKHLEDKFESHKNLVLFIGNNETIDFNMEGSGLFSEKLWQGEIETVIAAGHFKTYGELWTPK
ncbi:phosphoribosyltransferase family protein [Roseivirga sp. E12]|uniref:phosphoribosyltransferase family protein n=1 Tax=Roseivirga sp. E12 TaxID=2819237 RepID=UPI001ABCC205|nr:phosphoribosyltransferase family protein [Roseivirga sp. E12]MBO3696973.1 hypothetical protein [Roseivirga sp. E12]